MALTALHGCNERAIESMMGKAMCAYANRIEASRLPYTDAAFRHVPQGEVIAALESEYEATVRCIAMLVQEPLPRICMEVKERVRDEFGVAA